ncbi:hypothetical protein GGH12_006187 [Coemansia sp. RSA 1822]|nr:hypothetical protein LPJ76_006295 [Coemansia sp. RSA 638]KAJ2537936.1 hypothetical protein GGF49_006179 [Coemansia sp. RSA 1853]KAJ2557404.1 hypothetical protein GGH12_006187 [Coemansia sp. RSA 1822]
MYFTKTHAIIAAAVVGSASAQFKFDPMGFDTSELELFLSAGYFSYASIWNDQLSQAKASLPGAYSILTSIYNTDEVPKTYDPEFVENLAEEMIKIGPTTVVDAQVNSNTLQFSSTSTKESAAETSASESQNASSSSESNSEAADSSASNDNSSMSSQENSLSNEESSGEQSSDEDVFSLSNEEPEESDTSSAAVNAKPATVLGGIVGSLALAAALGYF